MAGGSSPGKAGTGQYLRVALAALLVLCASAALWYFPKEYAFRRQNPQNLNPENGVWDLTGFDLESEIVFLEGTVEYVAGAHLAPAEFDAYPGAVHYGRVPQDEPVITARLVLLFPSDQSYTLAVSTADYSERAWVNGELRYQVGSPGLAAADATAGKAFVVFDVSPQNGRVEIVRQGANFVHKEGSGYTGYYVGSSANIRQMEALSQGFIAVEIGLFLCLFLLHLILFLVLRSYRPNLWFGLLCFVWLFRAGFTGQSVFWSMFPGMSWEAMYKLGCVSIALSGVLLLMLVRDQFPGVVQKWPLRVLLAAQAAFVPVYLVAGTVADSHIKVCSELLLYLMAGYLAVRFVLWLPRKLRERRLLAEQGITLVGLVAALFAMLHDALRYSNLLPGIVHYEIGDAGMLVLALLQMAAMVIGTMRQLATARQDAQIAWDTSELARKNERLALLRAENLEKDLELQRQILADIPGESLITCGPFTLNTARGQAFLGNQELELNPKEFALLAHLARESGQTMAPASLYEAVWRKPYVESDRALDSNLYRLRKKLAGSGYSITNVRGKGYRFEAE